MKTIEQLHGIAAYFLTRKRTNCKFSHIFDYYKKGDWYIFRGLYKCKHTITIYKVTLDEHGNFIKYD